MGGIRLRRIISAFITISLLMLALCGCSSSDAAKGDIPELVEPVDTVDLYRPVVRGDVLWSKTLIATVTGKDYCHFLKNPTSISEIKVDIGQYVNKGDVLASMDVSELAMQLEQNKLKLQGQIDGKVLQAAASQAEIDVLTKEYEDKQKTYEEIRQGNCEVYGELAPFPDIKLDTPMFTQMHAAEQNAKKDMEKAKTQLDVAVENASYKALLIEHKITIFQEEIERLESEMSKNSIVAEHDGYVTYVKDMSDGNSAAAYENIVIVTDREDISLEIEDKYEGTFWKEITAKKGEFFALMGGERYPVSLHEYSNSEYMAMESSKEYPCITFEMDKELQSKLNLTVSEQIPILHVYGKAENVLSVGLDSVNTDEDGSFVYVRTATGNEKRNVRLGLSNKLEVEVIDGLSEGEFVYYTSKSLPPKTYKKQIVSRGEFAPQNPVAGKPIREFTLSHSYVQKKEAIGGEVLVVADSKVNKGDLLCTVILPEGKSQITQKKNAIEDAGTSVLATQYANRKQKGNIEEALKVEQRPIQKEILEKRLLALETSEALSLHEAYVNEEVLKVELDYARRQLNDDGYRNIYADMDGIVTNVNIREGKTIAKDNHETEILRVRSLDSFKVGLRTGEDHLEEGAVVYFKNPKDESDMFTGTVVGTSAQTDKAYLAEYEGKTYVTKSISNKKLESYIQIDSENQDNYNLYGLFYSKCKIRDTIVLPLNAVFSETKEGETEVSYYYVWKIINNEPVKTYIETVPSVNGNVVCAFSGVAEGDEILVH